MIKFSDYMIIIERIEYEKIRIAVISYTFDFMFFRE